MSVIASARCCRPVIMSEVGDRPWWANSSRLELNVVSARIEEQRGGVWS